MALRSLQVKNPELTDEEPSTPEGACIFFGALAGAFIGVLVMVGVVAVDACGAGGVGVDPPNDISGYYYLVPMAISTAIGLLLGAYQGVYRPFRHPPLSFDTVEKKQAYQSWQELSSEVRERTGSMYLALQANVDLSQEKKLYSDLHKAITLAERREKLLEVPPVNPHLEDAYAEFELLRDEVDSLEKMKNSDVA